MTQQQELHDYLGVHELRYVRYGGSDYAVCMTCAAIKVMNAGNEYVTACISPRYKN